MKPIRLTQVLLLAFIMMDCGGKTNVNVYDNFDFNTLSPDLLATGEKIYADSCFPCHTYGTAGAASLFDFKEWDKVAEKGMDVILKSVMEGYQGANGVMPPKGNCWTCTDEEIRASILYIFHEVKNNRLQSN